MDGASQKILHFGLSFLILIFAFSIWIPTAQAFTIAKPANYLTTGSGLVGWWTFDGPDMTSNVRDRSGQGNHGYRISQTVTTVIGKIGQALSINGSPAVGGGDMVEIGVSPEIITGRESNWTVCGWVKLDTNVTASDSGYILYTRTNTSAFPATGSLIIYADYSDTKATRWIVQTDTSTVHQSSTKLSPNIWYHLCHVVSNDTTLTFYLNGLQDAQMAYTEPGADGDTLHQTIGSSYNSGNGNGNETLDGAVDDIRVYNRALSASEIMQLYNLGR